MKAALDTRVSTKDNGQDTANQLTLLHDFCISPKLGQYVAGSFQSNQSPSSSTTPGLGGAIYNAGVNTFSCSGTLCFPIFHAPPLTLNTVYMFGNNAGQFGHGGNGGAIYSLGNTGILFGCCTGITNVIDSYFLLNQAGSYGGAIDNEGTAQLSVTRSTIQQGIAFTAGSQIRNAQEGLTISNSTVVTGECIGGAPDALDNESASPSLVQYSTFEFTCNGYGIGGGGKVELESTILVGGPEYSFQGENPGSWQDAANILDGGYNLETDNSCGLSATNNSVTNTNPNLGGPPLGPNGGPTPTFTLPTGSPAIDKIPLGVLNCGTLNTAGAFDQRGVVRPQNFLCDIGAIEHLFSNLPTSATTCNGIYNKTFSGDITVLPGQSCVFVAGGITGNVQVKGGRFEVRYASVGGNVEIQGDSSFSIGPSATVGGDLEIHNLEQSAAENHVCGSNIHGLLDVHNSGAAVVIGEQDSASCPSNTIGGSVEVHNNNASTSIDGNNIAGDVEDHKNGGPTEVFTNLIQGNLDCRQNSSITGGRDVAKQKQGQCASF